MSITEDDINILVKDKCEKVMNMLTFLIQKGKGGEKARSSILSIVVENLGCSNIALFIAFVVFDLQREIQRRRIWRKTLKLISCTIWIVKGPPGVPTSPGS